MLAIISVIRIGEEFKAAYCGAGPVEVPKNAELR